MRTLLLALFIALALAPSIALALALDNATTTPLESCNAQLKMAEEKLEAARTDTPGSEFVTRERYESKDSLRWGVSFFCFTGAALIGGVIIVYVQKKKS